MLGPVKWQAIVIKGGRFELSATALSLFVGAFGVLPLCARCLSLRSLFFLNMLALLHRCYIWRLWNMGVLLLYYWRLLAKLYYILDVAFFYGFATNDKAKDQIWDRLFADVFQRPFRA